MFDLYNGVIVILWNTNMILLYIMVYVLVCHGIDLVE